MSEVTQRVAVLDWLFSLGRMLWLWLWFLPFAHWVVVIAEN